MKPTVFPALLVALAMFATGCSEQTEPAEPEAPPMDPQQCFRNEFGEDLGGVIEVQELRVEIDGKKVTGVYNWLPGEKDARRGSLEGELGDEGVVVATYVFSQEGQEQTAELRIKLHSGQATVTALQPGSGLDASLKRVDCE